MKRIRWALMVAALVAAASWCGRARAVGWDGDDFIITGAPNFPQYIGIFDHDLTFKGYLDTNFLGVHGMDFDASGNLVAQASLSTNPEIRVYSPSGARIGGFFTNNPTLQYTGNLKVAPDGNYAFGSNTGGVQVYTPQGAFVRQYGSGDSRGIAYLPGNRLWRTGEGTIATVFDAISGAQVGTFTLDHQTMGYSMQYSPMTNTVLIVDADPNVGGVYERDLNGALLREFHVPHPTNAYGATRGPGGEVYATHDWYAPSYPDLVHWSADGTVLEEKAIWPVEITPVDILWAGSVPEPGASALIIGICSVALSRGRRPRMSGCHA